MDLSGRINPPSFGKAEYYFKITDLHTRHRHVYLLSKKSETFTFFLQYYAEVTNHHSLNINTVIFDGGGEFNSKEFTTFLKEKGIQIQVTAPHTPQQNAVAERGNRTTSEKTRALLRQANLPPQYWAEAVSTAIFLENITPTRTINWQTPYELWFGSKFNTKRLRPFGCLAYFNIPKTTRDGKLGDTAKRGLMMGYQLGMHNWRILTAGGKVERSHDVNFDETKFSGVSLFSSADPSGMHDLSLPEDFEEVESIDKADSLPEDDQQEFSVYHTDDEFHSADEQQVDQTDSNQMEDDSLPPVPPDNQATQDSQRGSTLPNTRPGKPGYDYLLTSDKAPRDINGDINESQILNYKRRAAIAVAFFVGGHQVIETER
jgi:hypothetical protein